MINVLEKVILLSLLAKRIICFFGNYPSPDSAMQQLSFVNSLSIDMGLRGGHIEYENFSVLLVQ
jgi:hypothetical protein